MLSLLFSSRLKVWFRFFIVVLFIKILSVLLSVFLSSAMFCFNLCFILFYASFGFHFFCVPFPLYVLGGHLRHEQHSVMPVEYVRTKTVNIRPFFVLALFAEAFRRGGYVGGFYPCAEDVIEISCRHSEYIAQASQLGIVQEGLSVLFVGLVLLHSEASFAGLQNFLPPRRGIFHVEVPVEYFPCQILHETCVPFRFLRASLPCQVLHGFANPLSYYEFLSFFLPAND